MLNMTLPFWTAPKGILILNGKYDDMHSMWYFNIGTQIMFTMMIGPMINQAGMFSSNILKTFLRWKDRGWSLSLERCEKYEETNTDT